MSKVSDISILLAQYKKAKEAYKVAEAAFDNAAAPDVERAFDEFEKAEDNMSSLACTIVEELLETM